MKNEDGYFKSAIVKKKLSYQYANGKTCEHSVFIKKKTIKKESDGAKAVKIFKKVSRYEDVAFGTLELVDRYTYITTLLID